MWLFVPKNGNLLGAAAVKDAIVFPDPTSVSSLPGGKIFSSIWFPSQIDKAFFDRALKMLLIAPVYSVVCLPYPLKPKTAPTNQPSILHSRRSISSSFVQTQLHHHLTCSSPGNGCVACVAFLPAGVLQERAALKLETGSCSDLLQEERLSVWIALKSGFPF